MYRGAIEHAGEYRRDLGGYAGAPGEYGEASVSRGTALMSCVEANTLTESACGRCCQIASGSSDGRVYHITHWTYDGREKEG